jgi:hypothetical protein
VPSQRLSGGPASRGPPTESRLPGHTYPAAVDGLANIHVGRARVSNQPMPSRRAVLAAVAAVGGGASQARGAPRTGQPRRLAGVQSAGFYDDFADGEWRDRWSVYAESGTADVGLVDPPGSSESALELTQASGGGAATRVGWAEPRTGWGQPWQLSGRFYVDSFVEGRPWQGHNVRLYADPDDGDTVLQLRLGFRDGDGEPWLFGLGGEALDERVGRDVDWRLDTWYDYRLVHDGDGHYDACLWAGGDAVASVAVADGPRLGDDERVAVLDVNGGDRKRVTVAHDVVEWRPVDVQSSGASGAAPGTAIPEGACPGRSVVEVGTGTDDGTSGDSAIETDYGSVSSPDADRPPNSAWLAGWAPLLAWLAGVPVVGPLVLGALVALEGRYRHDADEGDGR